MIQKSGALLDRDRIYRYKLWRQWDSGKSKVVFVMLNPSTADEQASDHTLDKCISFAKRWGCGGLEIVNLFAFRTPKPDKMKLCSDPVGPDNDKHIFEAVKEAEFVVGAWGNNGGHLLRYQDVIRLIAPHKEIHCLGITKHGHPKHPLYVPLDKQLEVFWPKG